MAFWGVEVKPGRPFTHAASAARGRLHISQVSIRYVGKVKENGEVFCSNISKAAFKFQLGAGDVIEGWNVGIDGMRVGGKSRLTVPPILGSANRTPFVYGSEGAAGIVPPNSWLVFEFELVKVR